jgi:hypothetical protein
VSQKAYIKNVHPIGNQHIGGTGGMLQSGEVREVEASRLPKLLSEYIRECDDTGKVLDVVQTIKVRRRTGGDDGDEVDDQSGDEVDDQSQGSGEKPSEADFLAGFPEDLIRDQANAIATYYKVEDRTVTAWLKNGEIKGAHKTGEAHNSPWSIPKAGLLERIQAG